MHGICTFLGEAATPNLMYGIQASCKVASLPMTPRQHKMNVGDRLRTSIEALNLSQAEVARAFGVSPSNLGNWLRGDAYPNPLFVKQFCDRYGVNADYLYRGEVSALPVKLADALVAAQGLKPEE